MIDDGEIKAIFEAYGRPGISKMRVILDGLGKEYRHADVKRVVKTDAVNEVFNDKKERASKPITSLFLNEFWQVDLLDMQKLKTRNKGFNYLLVAVDVFSRFARVEPIKTKRPPDVVAAFEPWLRDGKPKVVTTDGGSEFKGSFHAMLVKNSIVHKTNILHDHNTLGIVDRFAKTIKTTLYKLMAAKDDQNYIQYLDKVAHMYNHTPHSSLGDFTPAEATMRANGPLIQMLHIKKKLEAPVTRVKLGVRPGDQVRQRLIDKGDDNVIKKPRSFEPKFSRETQRVKRVRGKEVTLEDGTMLKIDDLKKARAGNLVSTAVEKAKENSRVRSRLFRAGLDQAVRDAEREIIETGEDITLKQKIDKPKQMRVRRLPSKFKDHVLDEIAEPEAPPTEPPPRQPEPQKTNPVAKKKRMTAVQRARQEAEAFLSR